MPGTRILSALVVLLGLSACATPQLATRNAPFETVPDTPVISAAVTTNETAAIPAIPQRPEAAQAQMQIVDYEIKVPSGLRVSEANLYYPIADIVWRGDPHGDRYEQVARIFEEGVKRAQSRLDGPRAVKAEIEIKRFHSLTEKTRYTVGGVHSIAFYLTVRDAQTGQVVVDKHKVKADLAAYGGQRAIAADKQGLTMKERIQSHLARVLAAELTQPNGWQDQDRRIARAVDQI